MAKYTHSFMVKGELDSSNMEVEEATKESIEIHDLQEVLNSFHGKVVSISIKEEIIARPKEEQY